MKDYVVSGAAQSYDDYTRLVGRYDILFETYQELLEMRSRYIDS